MATFKKKALSHYLRTNCERRLRLDLYPDDSSDLARQERAIQGGMPPADSGRPALVGLREAGEDWETEVFHDLIRVFPNRVEFSLNPNDKFIRVDLLSILNSQDLPRFVLEPSFNVTPSFISKYNLDNLSDRLNALGHGNLRYAQEFRPDIIEINERPDERSRTSINVEGDITNEPEGKIALRVIDIKLTSTPSVSYFAEVALYCMILSQWLVDNHLDQKFFVSADAAVWPGQHSGSKLGQAYLEAEKNKKTLTVSEAIGFLHEDLVILPQDVYVARVKDFLKEELPNVLLEPNWQSLSWHVSPACMGCEYLGYEWTTQTVVDKEHCWPKAISQSNLSQVIGITRGASKVLSAHKIGDIKSLSKLKATSPIFDEHYTLRATRSVLKDRANILGTNSSQRANRSSNTLLPKNVDVTVLIGVEFDISSGISLAFSWKAWELSSEGRVNKSEDVFTVEEKNLDTERAVLLLWLEKITAYLDDARNKDEDLTYQVYLWDETSFNHLKRVISRHLADIIKHKNNLVSFSWMFPPDEILPEPKYAEASRPLSIVKSLILKSISADIPFYYNMTLLSGQYYPNALQTRPSRSFSTMYHDPLSDHIPSERAHDLWTKSERTYFHYKDVEKQIVKTCRQKLTSLDLIIWRAAEDFQQGSRPSAPPLKSFSPQRKIGGVSSDGELWYTFAHLNSALQSAEYARIQSLEEYEREARFYSVRLDKLITGKAAYEVLNKNNLISGDFLVFKVSERSRHSKVKSDSIGYSLLPESLSHLASYKVIYFLNKHGISLDSIVSVASSTH